MTPRAVSALLGSQPRPSMIAGIIVRHIAASTGPTSPPTPPVRATPPSTAAATLLSVALAPMSPWLAAAGRGRDHQAGEAGEQATEGVGRDPGCGRVDTPERNAALRLLPVA